MDPVKVDEAKFRTAFVLILVLLISGLFLAVTWPFLQALLVGAMLAGLCQPLYRWLVRLLGGRRSLASAATLLILLAILIGPVSAVLGLVVGQALTVSERAIPWIQENFGAATTIDFRQWLINHFPAIWLAGPQLSQREQRASCFNFVSRSMPCSFSCETVEQSSSASSIIFL